MLVLGIDIGSLTAKAVLMADAEIIKTHIIPVRSRAAESAEVVAETVLAAARYTIGDVDYCCSTGYGRAEIPFAHLNKTEIACHALGAFGLDPRVRCVIDIGGQDCKIISINEYGMVDDFVMNDKCAAGTGRNLEVHAKILGMSVDALGSCMVHARGKHSISNKCSIFMEMEAMQLLYSGVSVWEIAHAVNCAVARRVAQLARQITVHPRVCITGGVSKNTAVVRFLEEELGLKLSPLAFDPQLVGALGAAFFAVQSVSAASDCA